MSYHNLYGLNRERAWREGGEGGGGERGNNVNPYIVMYRGCILH